METTYSLSNGKTLKIVKDENPETPRSWDNLSQMIFFGKHKSYGDDHKVDNLIYHNWDALQKAIAEDLDVAVVKPIYLYSHSGETISTKPFSCRWDSGQIGFAIVKKQAIREEYSIKRVTQKYIDLAEKILKAEVETLDQYVSGDVYGFELLDENDNVDDSCWGFYGSDIKTNGILDNLNELEKKEVLKQL